MFGHVSWINGRQKTTIFCLVSLKLWTFKSPPHDTVGCFKAPPVNLLFEENFSVFKIGYHNKLLYKLHCSKTRGNQKSLDTYSGGAEEKCEKSKLGLLIK